MKRDFFKFGLTIYILAVIIGIGFLYLKFKNILPARVKLQNVNYQNSEIKKNVSLARIEKHGDIYVAKIINFYVNAKVKAVFPFEDFKYKRGNLFFKRKVGIKGDIIPLYIELTLPNKKFRAYSKIEIGNLGEERIKELVNKENYILRDFKTFVFAKNLKNRCAILSIDEEKKQFSIVCNIDRDFNQNRKLEGLYIISSNSAVKLPFNYSMKRSLTTNERLILRKYIKYLILADTFLNQNILNRIKNDFKQTAQSILSPYNLHINGIIFETR